MLECNRYIHKKLTTLIRAVLLLLPLVCVILLLTQVAFAKNTYVINDGDTVVFHTTHTMDPKEVLNEAGLELGEDDTYTTQEGLGISEITIQRGQNIEILCDGRIVATTTQGETVGSLLARMNITLGQFDTVVPAVNQETGDGMRITVTRAVTTMEYTAGTVPYQTFCYYSDELEPDQQIVLQQGVEGSLLLSEMVVCLNGEEISREELDTVVTIEPVEHIVVTGSADVQNAGNVEDHVAEILRVIAPEYAAESGMPYIGNGMIAATDGEVYFYSDELAVKATAYNNADPGCTIYTAIGTYCRVGAIAVDPKVIPYGTRMFIVTNDGKYIYGVAVAEDCGGAIKGNRIDLYFDTVAECNKFGVRQATVYFIDGFCVE